MPEPTQAEMLELIEDAVGEHEADRLIVCEFGTIKNTFDHLVSIHSIILED